MKTLTTAAAGFGPRVRLERRPRCVCRALARDALAAPSRLFRLIYDLSKRGKGASGLTPFGPGRAAPDDPLLTPSIAQHPTASVNTYFSTASITRGCKSPRAAS